MDAAKTWGALLCAGALGLATAAARVDSAGTAIVLKDYLGHAWENECIQMPLSPEQWQLVEAGRALVGPDGEPVPWQIVPGDGADPADRKLAFQADLPRLATAVYRFVDRPATADTDLLLADDKPDTLSIVNAHTGVALRKQPAAGQGPISGIRLASGEWVGGSRWTGGGQDFSYTTGITARGPVFAEVRCAFKAPDGLSWQLRFRVFADEPVVLVEETFDAGRTTGRFQLTISPVLQPDRIFYRLGKPAAGINYGGLQTAATADLSNPIFHLEPWLRWYRAERRYNWVAFFSEHKPDLLTLAVVRPGRWVDPERRRNGTQPPTHVMVTKEDDGLVATFPFEGAGERHWMLAALDKDICLAPLQREPPDLYSSPLPHEYLVKHGDFPLDLVRGYVLEWDAENDTYPRLFVEPEGLARFRETYEPDPALLQRLLHNPLRQHGMGPTIQHYLGTQDPQLGRKIADTAVEWVQSATDMYLNQDDLVTLGFAPHHQTRVLTAATLTDVALSTGQLTPELRQRLKAQFAFIGYTVSRPDYWSPERGYAANANMTTTVNAYKCAIGSLFSEHPLAEAWVADAMRELKDVELDTWSDDNSGWLEAPHYAMVSYDYLVGCFLMAHNAGFNDHLFDPKMKKVIEWLAKISTPPDDRINGIRHRPPIGNSYLFEPTSEFGLMAYLWRTHDPEFASHMQWMHRQGGAYPEPGIGGFFPTLAGYRGMLLDPSIPERPPDWKSELFPEAGVILRHGFPGPAETQLYLIAGRHHDHYDYDSGSVTIWGKGRIVADDFGYYGRAPAEDHSLVEAAVAGNSPMTVEAFQPAERLDYVSGRKQGWTRQVAFVKDPDPLGPNYFVISDGFSVPARGHWRLWLSASDVATQARAAYVEGNEDVDTDIFFARPERPVLSTEAKTRRSGSGLKQNMSWGPLESTQIGLIAELEGDRAVTTVIYPRKQNEAPPKCAALADGKGVRIETGAGTDYVFLDAQPFRFEQDDIRFEGTAGCIQLRGGKPVLCLGAAGRIAVGDESVERGRVVYSAPNVFPDGDFAADEQTVFPPEMRGIVVTRAEEPLAESDPARSTPGCAVLTFAGGRGYTRVDRNLYVDPAKTYRFGITVKTDAKITGTIGGYAQGHSGKQLMADNGGPTWGWSLGMYGPTDGWERLQTTIGPAGAGAAVTWPADVLYTWVHIHFAGDAGKVLVDDIVFGPLP